jgi:hypothetical protein
MLAKIGSMGAAFGKRGDEDITLTNSAFSLALGGHSRPYFVGGEKSVMGMDS